MVKNLNGAKNETMVMVPGQLHTKKHVKTKKNQSLDSNNVESNDV